MKGSVGAKKANGQKSENYPDDVFYVRVWLNRHILWNPLFKKEGFNKQFSTIIAASEIGYLKGIGDMLIPFN